MVNPFLSVAIVNFNKGPLLLACLDSLYKNSGGVRLQVTVTDNASSDGLRDILLSLYPKVRLISNERNVGFARATNQALAVSEGSHVLLLNPDTVVLDGALEALMQHLEAHPEVGAVGPQMIGPDGEIQLSGRSFPGYATALFNRYSLLTRWVPRNRFSRDYLLSDWDHAQTREVDWVSGACLMTRKDVLARVGPLDEQFFLFNEDVDWCKRVRDAGWKVIYLPRARVVHHIGASKDKVPAALVVARHRGMIHYYHKHMRHGPPWDELVWLLVWARCGYQLLLNALRRP